MRGDTGESLDSMRRGRLPGALSQSTSAVSSALAEFFGRALDMIGRHVASAVDTGLSRGSGAPEVGWLESVMQTYRDALGEASLLIPALAQRIDVELQGVAGRHLLFKSLLFSAPGDPAMIDEAMSGRARYFSDDLARARYFFTSPEVIRRIVEKAREEPLLQPGFVAEGGARKPDSEYFKELTEAVAECIDGDDLQDVPKWLDDVKFSFRRGDKVAIATAYYHLGGLVTKVATRLPEINAFVRAMRAALGPECFRRMLRPFWLARYADAFQRAFPPAGSQTDHAVAKAERAADHAMKECEARRTAAHDWLFECFARAGFQVGSAYSMLANDRTILLLDHTHDEIFEISLERCAPGSRESVAQTNQVPSLRSLRPIGGRPEGRGYSDPEGTTYMRVHGERDGRLYPAGLQVSPNVPLDREIRLPLRIFRGSQALAVWMVDKRVVQEDLDLCGLPGEMRAWDMGGERTPVVLYFLDSKEGDLEPYLELGLGCLVSPRDDPLGVGLYSFGPIFVGTEASAATGQVIWGFDKIFNPHMRAAYDETSVNIVIGSNEGTPVLRVKLPRGGVSRSAGIPILLYTLKSCTPKGDSSTNEGPDDTDFWHRSVLTRHGDGESVRRGGAGVQVEILPWKNATGSSGATGDDSIGNQLIRFADRLARFGIVSRVGGSMDLAPQYVTWTESLRGELTPARPVGRRASAGASDTGDLPG